MPLHYLYFSTINLYNITTKYPPMRKFVPLERGFLKNCKSRSNWAAINLHFFKGFSDKNLFDRPIGRFCAARRYAMIECGRRRRDWAAKMRTAGRGRAVLKNAAVEQPVERGRALKVGTAAVECERRRVIGAAMGGRGSGATDRSKPVRLWVGRAVGSAAAEKFFERWLASLEEKSRQNEKLGGRERCGVGRR